GSCAAGVHERTDSRLKREIRLDLAEVPLSDLCAVLQRRTGVVLRPADERTGNLPVSAIGSLTVEQVQKCTADVLGVAWKRVGTGEPAEYEVRLPKEQIAEEERQQAARERLVQEWFRGLLQIAQLPDDELDAL